MSSVDKVCPRCGEKLYRYMIQMKHAVVMCSNEQCPYPFNEPQGVEGNLVYVDGTDLLEAAHASSLNDQENKNKNKN
ncbi:Uncharacterized protein RNJ44_04352 [Nakaseomyces bracarensis]|uniref:Uncharacterized protein n=1 Tax=Nakaseomyces bracarensis TaxID=273131 RepID=A0ABR4NUN0_9SACH